VQITEAKLKKARERRALLMNFSPKLTGKIIIKKPVLRRTRALDKSGSGLLSHCYAVPLALAGLTSLFGMGRGGAPPL
jgi:hypothetical protein